MSTYDMLIREGEIKGKIKGKIEGKIELISNIIKNRPDLDDKAISEMTGVDIKSIKESRNSIP